MHPLPYPWGHVRASRRAPVRRPRALPPRCHGRRRRGHGRRRGRPGDPVRRACSGSAPATSPGAWTTSRRSSRPSRWPQKTRILDADGNLIATIYDENRVNVPLTQISRTMVKAIVAIEDYRFYEHGALDLQGHAARADHQPGQRRRRPGWLVDHPADGQADPAQPGQHQGRARARRPTTPTRARSASCATRSRSRRSTPRTGSSSATSTSPTSATAPSASRPPPATTSTTTPRTSTCASRRCWPAW